MESETVSKRSDTTRYPICTIKKSMPDFNTPSCQAVPATAKTDMFNMFTQFIGKQFEA